jgi:hypothetical protein
VQPTVRSAGGTVERCIPQADGLLDNPTAGTADQEVVDFQQSKFSPLLDRLDCAERGAARCQRTTLLCPADQGGPFTCPGAPAERSAGP